VYNFDNAINDFLKTLCLCSGQNNHFFQKKELITHILNILVHKVFEQIYNEFCKNHVKKDFKFCFHKILFKSPSTSMPS